MWHHDTALCQGGDRVWDDDHDTSPSPSELWDDFGIEQLLLCPLGNDSCSRQLVPHWSTGHAQSSDCSGGEERSLLRVKVSSNRRSSRPRGQLYATVREKLMSPGWGKGVSVVPRAGILSALLGKFLVMWQCSLGHLKIKRNRIDYFGQYCYYPENSQIRLLKNLLLLR